MGGLETYDGVPTPAERQRSAPNNGSVSRLPLRNGRQRKRLRCGIGSGNGGGDSVPLGGTDTRSRMSAACFGGGGGEKGSWRKLRGIKMKRG